MMAAEKEQDRCACNECRELDRQHPSEGYQLKLLGTDAALAPSVSPEAIVQILRGGRYRASTEAALQGSIADVLTAAGVAFEREKVLAPGERIDFYAGGVGIEAKARANKRSTFRQLERYAANPAIDALVLITGTAMGLPNQAKGKPLFYVSLGRTAL